MVVTVVMGMKMVLVTVVDRAMSVWVVSPPMVVVVIPLVTETVVVLVVIWTAVTVGEAE